jgi:hypothetical protein
MRAAAHNRLPDPSAGTQAQRPGASKTFQPIEWRGWALRRGVENEQMKKCFSDTTA